MRFRHCTPIRIAASFLALAPPVTAYAWEKHQALMPGILKSLPSGTPEDALLKKPLTAPCADADRATYLKLAAELALNPNPKDGIPPTLPGGCATSGSSKPVTVTGLEILAGTAVDEPDFGMDQDLPYPPETYDPQGFQKWMGGTQGATSKGFRHMYFGGWQLWHPIHTFQIPTHAVGLAPERAAMMAKKARELIHTGDPVRMAWGFRVMGWAIHYVQDLTQPFHSTQVPSTRMVPWYSLLQWPPSKGFDELVRETTRTMSNYHFAYEDYTLLRVKAVGEEIPPFAECLEKPDDTAPLGNDAHKEGLGKDPAFLANRVAKSSVQLAPQVGKAVYDFFSAGLKDPGVDLPRNLGAPNIAEMVLRPDLVDSREELRKVTCQALANASFASRILIQWVLAP